MHTTWWQRGTVSSLPLSGTHTVMHDILSYMCACVQQAQLSRDDDCTGCLHAININNLSHATVKNATCMGKFLGVSLLQ